MSSRIFSALLFLAIAPLQKGESEERFPVALAEEGTLELEASWEPCRTSLYRLFERTPVLRSPRPAEARKSYSVQDFQPLLPAEPVPVGEVWAIEDEAVLAFLRQFHPGACRQAGFFGGEAPGSRALLRAVGEGGFEILLRTHASFELEGGVFYKPAQFEGRLVLGRDGGLRSFSLSLPSRDTNVDVNVPLREETGSAHPAMSADIGWVPRMELTSGPSPAIDWSHELSDEYARLALRRAFYRFAALDWLPLEEAVASSRASGKPLHLVLLFGCLDDDSC